MFCHMSAIDVKVGTRCRAAGGGQGGRHGPRHGAAPALERQPERCAGRSRDLHRRLQALIVAAQARGGRTLNRPARIRSGLAGPRVLQRDPVQRVLVHAFGVEHLFVELQQFGFLFVQAVVELDFGVGVGQPGVAQAVDESLARLAEQASHFRPWRISCARGQADRRRLATLGSGPSCFMRVPPAGRGRNAAFSMNRRILHYGTAPAGLSGRAIRHCAP